MNNPILKLIVTSLVRHLFTIVSTLLVTRHFIGQDIADKLMRGDTVTLWSGYTLSIGTVTSYTMLSLVPSLLAMWWSIWTRIKARFKTVTALTVATPRDLTNAVNNASVGEIVSTVATTPI